MIRRPTAIFQSNDPFANSSPDPLTQTGISDESLIPMPHPVVHTLTDFLENDLQMQPHFDFEEAADELPVKQLGHEDWPRVEQLEVDMDDQSDGASDSSKRHSRHEATAIHGIIPSGQKELESLASYISKISSSLRLSSQKETMHLVAEGSLKESHHLLDMKKGGKQDSSLESSKTSNADDAGTHSQSVFITQLPKALDIAKPRLAMPPKTFDFADLHNSKVVESAVFPGLEDTGRVLPNNLHPGSVISTIFLFWDVAVCFSICSLYKYKTRVRWRKLFLSHRSQSILLDAFWFIWHHQFHPDDEIQEALLQRISKEYVQLFLGCTLLYKDEFFKAYPNVMAQSVSHAFTLCFPKSLKHFTMDFKTVICDAFCDWMMGLKPAVPWCQSWKVMDSFKHFKSEKSVVAGARESVTVPSPVVRETHDQELDVLTGVKNKPEDNAHKKKIAERPSCQLGPGPKVERVIFDVHSNSPVVSKYLSSIGHKRSHGSVKVHRSQVQRESVDPSLPTYKQVIKESRKSTQKALAEYKSRMEVAQKERNRMVIEMNAAIAREKQTAAKILSRPQWVKEKADQVIQEMHEQARIYREKVLAKKREREIIISMS